MTMLWLSGIVHWGSFGLLRRWQSSPTLPTHWNLPLLLFPVPEDKFQLKGWCFDSGEEIQTKSQAVIRTLPWNDFQQCFWSWKSHWDHCINAKGDYCKGDR
jgi:hypothetical protein